MGRKRSKGGDVGRAFRRADGRWGVPYWTAAGKPRQKTIPKKEPGIRSKKAAEAWVEAWLDERRLKGELPARSGRMGGPTVRKLAEQWLEKRDEVDPEDLAQATKSGNRSHLDKHILPVFGDDPVTALPQEGARLSKWIAELKKVRAKQTVRNVAATFTLLLDYAQSPDVGRILSHNPLREQWFKKLVPARKKREGRQEKIRDAVLAVEQAQQLLDCQDVEERHRVRYVVVFTAPMRDGELQGLRWQDIAFDGEIPFIGIRQAVAIKGQNGFASEQRPKEDWSIRKLPLHPAALAALKEWWEHGWERWTGRRPRRHDLVFPRPDRAPQRPRSAEDFVEDLKAADLPYRVNGIDVVFHDVRACVATWLVNEGVSEMLIRRFLGQAPVGAAEANYIKGNILPALREAVLKIKLEWSA